MCGGGGGGEWEGEGREWCGEVMEVGKEKLSFVPSTSQLQTTYMYMYMSHFATVKAGYLL